MAADFVAGIVKRPDLIRADHAPIGVLVAAGPARHVKSAVQAALFKQRGAVDVSGVWNVIESEGHKRRRIAHHQRL